MTQASKGGKPRTDTPADRRLAANRDKPATPKPAFPGAAAPFKPRPKPKKA